VNIYDIAKESGVSISTVSRVLNKSPNVTQVTKERVLEVLKKHNYVPSAVAKSMVSKTTQTIGVMALDVRHLHYANIAFTIEQELSSAGYNALLCNTGYDLAKMDVYVRMLAEKQVDGVIMVGSVFSRKETAESIARYLRPRPIVMHNTTLTGENVFSISTNEEHGIVLSLEYLLEKGRSRIAFVRDYDTPVGRAKQEAYRLGLLARGVAYDKRLVVNTLSGFDGGVRAVEKLISREVEFDALIGCDDLTSLGAMKRLAGERRNVPGDVSVIGFNNTVFSKLSDPPMTVVDNKEEMTGISLSRAMVDVLKGRDIPSQTILYPELVIRGSA
jgi:LacI family transcriptional regulator